jgi:DNA ligase 1
MVCIYCYINRKLFLSLLLTSIFTSIHFTGNMIYCVFDAPLLGGTFEERINILKKRLHNKKHVILCEQIPLKSLEQMNEYHNEVISRTPPGEGLMLRNPSSSYENKRSTHLLKVKTFHDAEAEVLEHLDGQGSNSNVCGSMLCKKINSNVTFKCGSGMTDADRANPPPIGSIITYSYFEESKDGVPRFPCFVRIRPSGT